MQILNDETQEIVSMLMALEEIEKTKGHSDIVGKIANYIGIEFNYRDTIVRTLTKAAYFHDVGKIKISREILEKPGKLTDHEYLMVKQHSRFSYDILLEHNMELEAEIALQHHELLDGSGYPLNLKNSSRLILSRIVTVIDVFESLIGDRPYRMPVPPELALLYLYQNAKTKFDLTVIQKLHFVLNKYEENIGIKVKSI